MKIKMIASSPATALMTAKTMSDHFRYVFLGKSRMSKMETETRERVREMTIKGW